MKILNNAPTREEIAKLASNVKTVEEGQAVRRLSTLACIRDLSLDIRESLETEQFEDAVLPHIWQGHELAEAVLLIFKEGDDEDRRMVLGYLCAILMKLMCESEERFKQGEALTSMLQMLQRNADPDDDTIDPLSIN